jgi:hypothetical protein
LRRWQHTLSVAPKSLQTGAQFLAVLALSEQGTRVPPQPEKLACPHGVAARVAAGSRQVVAGFACASRSWGAAGIFETDAPWIGVESSLERQTTRLCVGESTRTFIQDELWCAASSPVCFLYHAGGWTIQSRQPAWVSLRLPAGASFRWNETRYVGEPPYSVARLAVPGGETHIQFDQLQ